MPRALRSPEALRSKFSETPKVSIIAVVNL